MNNGCVKEKQSRIFSSQVYKYENASKLSSHIVFNKTDCVSIFHHQHCLNGTHSKNFKC